MKKFNFKSNVLMKSISVALATMVALPAAQAYNFYDAILCEAACCGSVLAAQEAIGLGSTGVDSVLEIACKAHKQVYSGPMANSGCSGKLINSIPLMRFLVSKGADVNRRFSGQPMLVRLLNARVNNDGDSCNVEVFEFLLDNGARIDDVDNKGRTALMTAADRHNVDAVRLLLERGADASLRDKDGKTALDFAQEYKEFLDHFRREFGSVPKNCDRVCAEILGLLRAHSQK